MASACIQWVLADYEIKKLPSIQGKYMYTLHSNILGCIVLQKLELTEAQILKPTSYSVSVLYIALLKLINNSSS